jgi:4,5-DOPA dioxygenase extradiol
VLFIGHGSPMNAIADNAFTRMLGDWARELGRPRAILMVSAHWLTEREVQVSTTATPETIYDFGGFPPELYRLRYPAPGAPQFARAAAQALAPRVAGIDATRGLDHGAWSVLLHMYPQADIPVFQLSIDIMKSGSYHHAIGRALAGLREQGVLIVGSGNVVHNLRVTMRDQPDTPHGMTPWAEEFDVQVKAAIDAGDARALMAYESLTPGALTAVPFPDHYFPLLYAMGAAQSGERARHVFEGFQAGTLSMRCVQWG